MLNVINGFYHPQQGRIEFRGVERRTMRPHVAARQGIARTFQNVALFKGMSTLDNIMTGRVLKMKRNLLQQAIYWGANRREEIAHRPTGEKIIDFLETHPIRRKYVGPPPTGLQNGLEQPPPLNLAHPSMIPTQPT